MADRKPGVPNPPKPHAPASPERRPANAPAPNEAGPPPHSAAPPPHPHPSIPQHVDGPPAFCAHYAFPAAVQGDHVRVDINTEANILLVSDAALEAYRRHLPFHYIGGGFARETHVLGVPTTGSWHVIIDLGGRPGHVEHHVGITHHNAPREPSAPR
jgi:hypothetical protein